MIELEEVTLMAEQVGAREGAQGVAALAGITLGVIPLVKVLFGGDVGVWLSWVPGTEVDPGRWAVPLVVVVVALAVMGGLELAGRRSR